MLDWMAELLNRFANVILGVLPHSPFAKYIDAMGNLPFLSTLNWIVPVGAIVKITLAWVGAIGIFYVWSAVMRWIKIIGD